MNEFFGAALSPGGWLLPVIASFFAAILGSMGMGGGGVLLIYLTLFGGMGQLAAQGINLLFFIPIAAIALIIHSKNHLVRWKVALPCLLTGVPGVFLGSWLAGVFGDGVLQKLFALFLLFIGVRELLSKKS